jgi:hypothetical protein
VKKTIFVVVIHNLKMKKLFSLLVILFLASSCSEEVKFNNPGFQALRDDVIWQGIDVNAYISEDGSLRIVALAEDGDLELYTSDSEVGTYYLGSTANNGANYNYTLNGANINYSTENTFGPILNISNLVLSNGLNYVAGNNVPTTSTNGGSGMRVNTTVNENGEITSVKISSPGSGYEAGDVITITGGDGTAKFKILSEIKITDFSNGTVTGTFKLTAKNLSPTNAGGELVNFQYGAFYKIPVQPEL